MRRTLTVAALAVVLMVGAATPPLASARDGCVMLPCTTFDVGSCESKWVRVGDFDQPSWTLYSANVGDFDRGTVTAVNLQAASPCIGGSDTDEEACGRMVASANVTVIDRSDGDTRGVGATKLSYVRIEAICDDTNECIGGTNDNVECTVDSECPGGVCGCRARGYLCGGMGGHE